MKSTMHENKFIEYILDIYMLSLHKIEGYALHKYNFKFLKFQQNLKLLLY